MHPDTQTIETEPAEQPGINDDFRAIETHYIGDGFTEEYDYDTDLPLEYIGDDGNPPDPPDDDPPVAEDTPDPIEETIQQLIAQARDRALGYHERRAVLGTLAHFGQQVARRDIIDLCIDLMLTDGTSIDQDARNQLREVLPRQQVIRSLTDRFETGEPEHADEIAHCLAAMNATETASIIAQHEGLLSLKGMKSLHDLGWQPTKQNEKLRFYLANEMWDELSQMGDIAVDYLMDALESSVLLSSYNHVARLKALGQMGNERALPFLNRYFAGKVRKITVYERGVVLEAIQQIISPEPDPEPIDEDNEDNNEDDIPFAEFDEDEPAVDPEPDQDVYRVICFDPEWSPDRDKHLNQLVALEQAGWVVREREYRMSTGSERAEARVFIWLERPATETAIIIQDDTTDPQPPHYETGEVFPWLMPRPTEKDEEE